jgi:phage terminase large subunit GpA-like protein
MLNQLEIERRLVALGNHEFDGNPAAPFLERLDMLLPQASISINEYDRTKRKLVNPGGEPFPYDADLTPYTDGIGDACDHPDVRVILVKGNTRSSKTTKAESMCLRDWTYGPLRNVCWVMQDEDALNRYIDERGEKLLQIHVEVNEKINWNDKRGGRQHKTIGTAEVFYLPASLNSLRGIAAPVFVADEIDAYKANVRDAITTLIRSRQEEFGTTSKAYICSHPDKGPTGGIDLLLQDSLLHLWFVKCPHCGGHSSPAKEVETWGKPRLTWNVPELMGQAEEIERGEFLDIVEASVVLCCPHDGCHATFGPDERHALMRTGRWLQPHQDIAEDGTVVGEPRVRSIMGFVIHAFMAPFVDLPETARDWAGASLTSAATGVDTHIKEVTVKKLGETFEGTRADEKMDTWQVLSARITSHYPVKYVPTGCLFLTQFVDIQGDRFEVRVIGWDLGKQSWLIDAYSIKQWPAFGKHGAFENLAPATRLGDWDIIDEAVINASYPLQANPQRLEAGLPELYLPVARTMVDAVGDPGVTGNARNWLANLLARGQTPEYKIKLVHGAASKTQKEIYGKPVPVLVDDKGKQLQMQIYERYPNVHEIKRIIATRMKVAEPGPGRMHLPSGISPRYVRELVAERLVNGDWTQVSTRNETWDAWVMCEVARATLQPDRPELWNQRDPATGQIIMPEWADPRPRGEAIDAGPIQPVSIFDRLAKLNEGGD